MLHQTFEWLQTRWQTNRLQTKDQTKINLLTLRKAREANIQAGKVIKAQMINLDQRGVQLEKPDLQMCHHVTLQR